MCKGRVHWGGVTSVDSRGGATLETGEGGGGEGGGAMRMYREMGTRERSKRRSGEGATQLGGRGGNL